MSTVAKEAKKVSRKLTASGLLSVSMHRHHLDFLGELFPEDFEQERANFLLVAPEAHPGKNNQKFFSAASAHFYRVAKDYGYRYRIPGNSSWGRREVETTPGEDETQEEVLDHISQGTSSPEQEFLQRERLAQAMKLSADLSTGFGRRRARAQIALRDEAWEEDGHMMAFCGLCGKTGEFDKMTIDHIIPRAQGGSDTLDNLQLAHEGCNYRKADRVSPLAEALEGAAMNRGTKVEVVRRIAAAMDQEELANLPTREIEARFKVGRVTAWRIKRRAAQGMYAEHGTTPPVPKVFLSSDDRLLSGSAVSKKYGISSHTALLAKQRGWFEVNEQNRDKIAANAREN